MAKHATQRNFSKIKLILKSINHNWLTRLVLQFKSLLSTYSLLGTYCLHALSVTRPVRLRLRTVQERFPGRLLGKWPTTEVTSLLAFQAAEQCLQSVYQLQAWMSIFRRSILNYPVN